MQMNVAEAKAKLTKLLAAAQAGEDVIIAKDGVPAVRLVPIAAQTVQLGLLSGQVGAETLPDFLEPMTEDELRDWEDS